MKKIYKFIKAEAPLVIMLWLVLSLLALLGKTFPRDNVLVCDQEGVVKTIIIPMTTGGWLSSHQNITFQYLCLSEIPIIIQGQYGQNNPYPKDITTQIGR